MSIRWLAVAACLLASIESVAQSAAPEAADRSTAEAAARPAATGMSHRGKPKWEVGLVAGHFSGFDYPASSDLNRRSLVLPYFIYRAPRWRVGEGGLRAVGIERSRLKLDLAASFSLGASSGDNNARAGLPDLDYLFEAGPQLEISLLDKNMPQGGRLLLRFTSELRGVLGTDFSQVSSRGFVAEAGVGVNYRNVRGSGIDVIASVSSSYASERMQDYFYQVDPAFATASRPSYEASAGYLGSRVFLGMGFRPRNNLRMFLGAFTGLYDGAKNQRSPLFETSHSTSFVLGMVWMLRKSDRLVQMVDLGSDSF